MTPLPQAGPRYNHGEPADTPRGAAAKARRPLSPARGQSLPPSLPPPRSQPAPQAALAPRCFALPRQRGEPRAETAERSRGEAGTAEAARQHTESGGKCRAQRAGGGPARPGECWPLCCPRAARGCRAAFRTWWLNL